MTWEERLLFLMFLDYKGALNEWERNHNKDKNGYAKIEDSPFFASDGFRWRNTRDGFDYWLEIHQQWKKENNIYFTVPSLQYEIHHKIFRDTIQVGCQKITKKDALKIADFIYECFGENE